MRPDEFEGDVTEVEDDPRVYDSEEAAIREMNRAYVWRPGPPATTPPLPANPHPDEEVPF